MTQKVLLKVYVGKGEEIAVTKAVSYKQTEKMVRDIVFDGDRYGDRYSNKQVRIEDMLKFYAYEWMSKPSSGCVYCFEEDLERAKEVLISGINYRLSQLLNKITSQLEDHNASVGVIAGVYKVSVTMDQYTTVVKS